MAAETFNLEEERLKKVLAEIYLSQMHHFFVDDVMAQIMEKLGLDEEQTIKIMSDLLSRGWVKCLGIKEKFFLRPGYIAGLPVVLTASGLNVIRN